MKINCFYITIKIFGKSCVSLFFLGLFICSSLRLSAQTDTNLFIKISTDIFYKNYTNAIENIDKALKLNPDNTALIIQRGDCNYFQKEYQNALSDYVKAEKIEQGSVSFQMTKCYSMLGKYDDAMKCLKSNVVSKYKKPQRIFNTDVAFENLRKTKEWREFWKGDYYSNLESSVAEAEYYIESGKFDKALELANELLLQHSNNIMLHHVKAMALSALDAKDEAEQEYKTIIKNKSNQPAFYIERATLYDKMNKHKKALNDLNKAIALDPFNLAILKNRAFSEWHLKMYDNAIADYQEYLKYFSFDQEAIYNCGLVFYDHQDYQESLSFFNKLLEEGGKINKYLIARGNVFLACKSFLFAETDYNQALDIDPFSGLTYLNRGLARFEQGFVEGACRDWQKAVNLKENDAIDFIEKHCSFNQSLK